MHPDLAAIGHEMFYLDERGLAEKWPRFDDQGFFELYLERALLTLTVDRDGFEQGSTVWRTHSKEA